MSFFDTAARAKAYLHAHGRVSLRALRREFALDDAELDELIEELVEVQRVAVREGAVLVSTTAAQSGSVPTARAMDATAAVAASSSGPGDQERRQLTVLFCDLVGSTELSTRLDAEDYGETIGAYHEAASHVVARFGGYVSQLLGDGLLVFFGYPQVQEDSAEQAVRAALDIVAAVDGLGRGLVVRIGLHSGLCVVGDIGAGGRQETLAFGDTVNVAARVQAAAAPSSVLMSASTHRLVAGWFVVEAAGSHTLKGVPEPMTLYRVVRATAARSRLEARSQRGLTPLVGRDAQRRLLLDHWAQARGGAGQVVLVSGEAGIGKSRLVHAFRDGLADEPHLWIECAASPHRQHTAIHAVVEMLRNGLAWRGDESVDERLQMLEQSLELTRMPLDEAVPLLAPLLGFPLPERYPPLGLLPDAQRKRTISTLESWLYGAARLQPVALVIEDLHWADPSSLELLERLAREGSAARILVLGTARPEFRAPWPLLAHHAHIALPRLSAAQVREMAKHVAREKALTQAKRSPHSPRASKCSPERGTSFPPW